MKGFFSVVLALFTACGTKVPSVPVQAQPVALPTRPPPSPRIEVLHEVLLNGVVAQFMGRRVPEGVSGRYGVEGIRFQFDDGRSLPFIPLGTLYFSDWRFDIDSPDGLHLLLLQDRYGPYHVVRVDQLADYLDGGKPAWEFGHKDPNGSAWIHEGGRWQSNTEILYRAGLTTLFEDSFSLE